VRGSRAPFAWGRWDASGLPRPLAASPSQAHPLRLPPILWYPLLVWEGKLKRGLQCRYARH
jgi:hypothetical protein